MKNNYIANKQLDNEWYIPMEWTINGVHFRQSGMNCKSNVVTYKRLDTNEYFKTDYLTLKRRLLDLGILKKLKNSLVYKK